MPLHSCQGDLLFLWQDTWPAATLTARQSNVIVAGETTGHAHHLQSDIILEAPDSALYLEITQTTQVIHEEHGPIPLDPCLWLVVRQREYRRAAIRRVEN